MQTPLVSVLLVVMILISSTLATTAVRINNSGFVIGPSSGRWFDYVVVIMMENHSINNTYDFGGHNCFGNCTYYTSFANSNGLAEEYTTDSIKAGSVGDYIAITSGYGNTLQGCNNNGPPAGCPLMPLRNIVDNLDSHGLSWKAYMEDYPKPSGCLNSFSGNYHPNHNPFIYYSDIQNNATRCSRIVNANPTPVTQTSCWPTSLQNDDALINDLNSPSTASKYMFLSPNTVDDNHDCDDVAIGNAWLNHEIPQILGTSLFQTKRAALFITFDESFCTNNTCTGPNDNEMYTVWASNPANPITKAGFRSVNAYNHYNPLRTIEDNWRLPPLNATTDGAATSMSEFFR